MESLLAVLLFTSVFMPVYLLFLCFFPIFFYRLSQAGIIKRIEEWRATPQTVVYWILSWILVIKLNTCWLKPTLCSQKWRFLILYFHEMKGEMLNISDWYKDRMYSPNFRSHNNYTFCFPSRSLDYKKGNSSLQQYWRGTSG